MLPALLESGASSLIDELYLECHVRDHVKNHTTADCARLLHAFRAEGVLTHIWF